MIDYQTSLTNYLSDESDTTRRTKINNVIKSLSCFISETTNDKTEQDYGIICYCGPITLGQIIKGTKIPKVANTPVIANNTFIGTIQGNGDLVVSNTYKVNSSWSKESRYQNISYSISNYTDDMDRYYNCGLREGFPQTSCTTCTCNGWIVDTVCTTWIYDISERCAWKKAYCDYECHTGDYDEYGRGSYAFDSESQMIHCYLLCCEYNEHLDKWCGESAPLTKFCEGKTCIISDMPPHILYRTGGNLDWPTHEIRPDIDCVALSMTASYCCTVCTINCKRTIDCICLNQRYV